jgi:hypothetical protein
LTHHPGAPVILHTLAGILNEVKDLISGRFFAFARVKVPAFIPGGGL